MAERRGEALLPVAGIGFGVLFAFGIVVGGDSPSPKASGEAVVAHYADRQGAQFATVIVLVLAAVLLVFFAATLTRHLRASTHEGSPLPSAVLAGGAIYGVALLFEAVVNIALIDIADKNLTDVARTFNLLENDDFFLFIGGLAIMLLATAGVALSGRGLPKWLGWVSLVLGLGALAGPVGIAAFLLFPIWVIVVSVLLLQRRTAPAI